MNEFSSADMLAATRSVQAGRLTEATALLQRLLRGEPAGTPADISDDAGPRAPCVIDLTPVTVEIGERRTERPAGRMPEALRGFLDRLGRTGLEPGSAGLGRPTSNPLPDGARFLSLSFSSGAGSRDYKLYVPSGYRGEKLPLVVMLHGCTQSPDDFAAGTQMNALAEEHLFLVAYPAQPTSANMSRCWNWFRAEDQQRDRGEPALIAGITRRIMGDYPVDPERVYVAGLSAGGAAAAIMGATYPDLYAAVGVHSGLAPGAASDMPSAFAAMRGGAVAPAARASRARPDDRLSRRRGQDGSSVQRRSGGRPGPHGFHQGLQATATVQQGQAPGGRTYRRTVHADAKGRPMLEQWVIHGAGHAWSGGSSAGSYTDPRGPDASREMVRFFLEHPRQEPARPSAP